ncbi:MAG: hypothetical protein KKA75_01020 [Proteobacteria bacterium]|nr:hypothetical protein [Pseudomonadota bacterium]
MNNDLKSISLVDMVDYQKEAVVSKTIIEKKTGTVTLLMNHTRCQPLKALKCC